MSQLLFPSVLQGMGISVTREPLDAVHVDEAESGKETRWTGSTYPRYRYQLDFNILRADSALANLARNREWQQFCTHVARHFGQLSDFLWTDPDDSSVTDMGFAVGDGTTASFQLQRSMGGDLIDAAGFEYAMQTKPYTNLVKNSSFETDSNADGLADSWTAYNTSSALEPATTAIVPGMNGGKAQRISWGTNNTTTKGFFQAVTLVAGQWYTFSWFARATGTVIGKTMQTAWDNAPSSTLTIANPALTTGWQRYVFQVFWNVGATISPNAYMSVLSAASCFGDLDFDLVQVSTGQYGASDLQPIETPAAAIGARTPAYWPAFGDGFEPVFDRNGDATIYEDGTWRGRRTLYPYPRTNLVQNSEQVNLWTALNATVTTEATTAPDGTATADQVSEGTAVTVQHRVNTSGPPADIVGELRCWSVFVKANNLPNINVAAPGAFGIGVNFNLGTGVIDSTTGSPVASGVITDPRWPGWYRVWFVRRGTVTGTNLFVSGCLDATYSSAGYTGTSRSFYVWGGMCEIISNANGPTPYIKTPGSAAVTVTDYSLSASALFTPPAVPAAGTFYSWDGSFYRRVRIDMGSVPTTRLVQAMYEAKRVQLISAKP